MPPGLGPDSFQKSYSGELSFCVGYSVATSIDVKVKRKNNRKKNNFGNLPNASILNKFQTQDKNKTLHLRKIQLTYLFPCYTALQNTKVQIEYFIYISWFVTRILIPQVIQVDDVSDVFTNASSSPCWWSSWRPATARCPPAGPRWCLRSQSWWGPPGPPSPAAPPCPAAAHVDIISSAVNDQSAKLYNHGEGPY